MSNVMCVCVLNISATAATTTTAAAFRLGPSFIDRQGPAIELLAIESGDGCLGLLIVGHFDEGKAFRPAGVPIHDDLDRCYGAMSFKSLAKRIIRGAIRQIADIQPLAHLVLRKSLAKGKKL